KMLGSGEDHGVYEMMCNASKQQECEGEDEDLYTPLGANDDLNSNLKSEKVVDLVNRPPAPTPRPECMQLKEGRTPYIVQVFKKKKIPKGNADVYSITSKQAERQEGSVPGIYDTFTPNQMQLEQLMELQQRIKTGSLTVGKAFNHFSNQQKQQQRAERQSAATSEGGTELCYFMLQIARENSDQVIRLSGNATQVQRKPK
ncbi:hypothetical protein ATANTOWER_006803, partial [Ataeniobius toweri]|nr:hypothetical protein [Ataeniobius toweri]